MMYQDSVCNAIHRIMNHRIMKSESYKLTHPRVL